MINLGCVTHECPCGSQAWVLDWVIFDDYVIAAYSTNMKCANCGATALAPTEPDRPGFDKEMVTV